MQSLPAFLIHLPENHGAQMTHNIKKHDSNKRLKPFETKVVRRTLNEGSAQAVLQKKSMADYVSLLESCSIWPHHPLGSHTKCQFPPVPV